LTNFILFLKCKIVSGRNVVKQVTNKLLRSHIHRTQTAIDREDLHTLLADVKKNGNSLHFPPLFVKRHDLFKGDKQTVYCEAFRITNE
jgi:hypothetical protein